MPEITIRTHSKEELLDITAEVKRAVAQAIAETESSANSRELRGAPGYHGICHIFALHTTAGLLINENADPSVKSDILMTLKRIVPDNLPFTHAEGNSPAHVKSTLVGHSLSIPIVNGKLALGTWQGIFFAEFDGPRTRKVTVTIVR